MASRRAGAVDPLAGPDADKKSDKKDEKKPKKYKTAKEAALAAVHEANPKSIDANREYGGMIYKNSDGTYSYNGPLQGNGDSFDPRQTPIPDGTEPVGDYHTHGDYSTIGPNGPVRTADPAKDQYGSDNFSQPDYDGIKNDSQGHPEYKGYLGTPSMQIRQYDPSTGKTTTIYK